MGPPRQSGRNASNRSKESRPPQTPPPFNMGNWTANAKSCYSGLLCPSRAFGRRGGGREGEVSTYNKSEAKRKGGRLGRRPHSLLEVAGEWQRLSVASMRHGGTAIGNTTRKLYAETDGRKAAGGSGGRSIARHSQEESSPCSPPPSFPLPARSA